MPRLGLILLFTLPGLVTAAPEPDPWQQLNWVTRDKLSDEHAQRLPSFCTGDYIARSPRSLPSGALEIESDEGEFEEQGLARFSGQVTMSKDGNLVKGDQAQYNQGSGEVLFENNIQFHQPQISMLANRLNYNTDTGAAQLSDAKYSMAQQHLRGTAGSLYLSEDETLALTDASYTFCEPGMNHWDLKASEIYLNRPEGYGEAYHARLRIKEVPILYLPYYRFPVSEDRLTGFLNPEISVGARTRDGETNVFINQLALPFYINIAPNYDNTFTPRYIRDHGYMAENEFRYLNIIGEGKLEVTHLADDDSNQLDPSDINYREDSERWSRTWIHNKRFAQHWQQRINYQEVSDVYYDNDFSRTGSINRSSYLKQNAELEFNDGKYQLLTRFEQYQTIDENVAANNKPYYRLPQVRFNSLDQFKDNQVNIQYEVDATQFKRNDPRLTGINKVDAERVHGQLAVSYPFRNIYSFVTPSLTVMSSHYEFQDLEQSLIDNGFSQETSRNLYTAQLDAGLFFERYLDLFGDDWVQTLEPRIMAAYTPFEDQQAIPLFDTTETSFSYSQLFNPNRFTGYDRIADTQQLTLGVTSRFIDAEGKEALRASIGQIFFFDEQQVALTPNTILDPDEQPSSSPLAGEVQWQFANNWRTRLDVQYNPHAQSEEEPVEKASWQLNYLDPAHWLFDMNFSHVQATKQKQVGISFFAPINDRFALYAQRKQDIYPYDTATRTQKQEDNLLNIESLVGLEYQNCCWRVQLTYEEQTQSNNVKDYQFMFQVHLKGLGIIGSKSETLLSERIYGYDQRQIHDY